MTAQMIATYDTARARLTDTLPSHVAADRSQQTISDVKVAVLVILAVVDFADGQGLNELYRNMRGQYGWPEVSWDSPRKRAGELLADGHLITLNPDCPRGTPAIYALPTKEIAA